MYRKEYKQVGNTLPIFAHLQEMVLYKRFSSLDGMSLEVSCIIVNGIVSIWLDLYFSLEIE